MRPRIGTAHHVAFRAPDDETHVALQARLAQAGLQPTPVIHRFDFRSVHFREPGASCSRSPPTGPASPSTSRSLRSAPSSS
ncbi:MAG: VOC family protein [Halofilum sp. (in: g-proteobacteria)]|nr:VOC family protein [Halofilum sp. (in: g-proteobacteria)]